MPFQRKRIPVDSWWIAKKVSLVAILLLVLQIMYYSQRASSPFEESAFYTVLFTIVANSSSIYGLYRKK